MERVTVVTADAVPAPVRGQTYITGQGQVWRIDEVLHSDQLPGFYIVRLCGASATAKACLVLDRREFQDFCRSNEVKQVTA